MKWTPKRKEIERELRALPFMKNIGKEERKEIGHNRRVYWTVEPSGDWGKDLNTGRSYGRAAIEFMRKYGRYWLLGFVVQDMIMRRKWGTVEQGFLDAIQSDMEETAKMASVSGLWDKTKGPSMAEKEAAGERWGRKYFPTMDMVTSINRLLYRVSPQSVEKTLRYLQHQASLEQGNQEPGKVVNFFPGQGKIATLLETTGS